MELSPDQIKEAKKQLIEQINQTFPEDKKQESIEKINLMNDEQFIEFLKQNNLIGSQEKNQEQNKCIFCSIVFGEIPSTKIGENNSSVAILEINPISYGHSIIVPKNHIENKENFDEETINLANEIKQKLQNAFNPKEIQLINQNILGHEIINILPIYENENINSPKKQATGEELEKIKNELEKETEQESSELTISPKEQEDKKTSLKPEEINEKNTWLPKRFP